MPVITRIEVHTHCHDLGGKVWNPAITWTKKYAVFVTLENQQGLIGLGECWCFDTAPDTLVAYLRTEICPHLIGLTIDECAAIHQYLLSKASLTARHGLLASAWSGIDIALWDLRSREAGVPLYNLLTPQTPIGTDTGRAVHLYASGGLYGKSKSIDDLVSEMDSMHAAGFNIVKMKIGALSIDRDLERIRAVLDGLKPSCKLIIDGVYSYTAAEALQVFNALPSDRLEAFQSPVKADDFDGMKFLCRRGVPVMGTEAEYRHEIHHQLVEHGLIHYLQTAPIACGGISRVLQLAELVTHCEHSNIKLSLEVSSTAVALLAAMHLGLASNCVAHVEYHYLHQVFFDKLNLSPVNNRLGWFQLPEKSGLGMNLPRSETQVMFSLT